MIELQKHALAQHFLQKRNPQEHVPNVQAMDLTDLHFVKGTQHTLLVVT